MPLEHGGPSKRTSTHALHRRPLRRLHEHRAPAQPPTPQAMFSSSETWQGTPWRRASAATATSMPCGPQAKISTSSRSAARQRREPGIGELGDVAAVAAREAGQAREPRWHAEILEQRHRRGRARGQPGAGSREATARTGKAAPNPSARAGWKPPRPAASVSARNTIGGMPTPPPISSRRGRAGLRRESAADRAEAGQRLARPAQRQLREPVADDLVEHLDPAVRGVRAHDRERPAHRQVGAAGEVDEAAGRRRRRAARRGEAQDELRRRRRRGARARRRPRGRSCRGALARRSRRPRPRASATCASTAMRTARPFATWRRITDCGPSATSESISTPRFIGPGCMTIARGLARREARRRQPELAVVGRQVHRCRRPRARAGCAAS